MELAKSLHDTCMKRYGIEQAEIDSLSAGNFAVRDKMKVRTVIDF